MGRLKIWLNKLKYKIYYIDKKDIKKPMTD